MGKPTLAQRIRVWWVYLRSQEPARVQAMWKALIGVALAVGVAVPDWLDARVSAGIAAVYVLLAFWQGEATRANVVPADNVPVQFYADNQGNTAGPV
jgi:hypothetical protein